ncbi:MAG: hypothetical protein ACTSRI_19115 [Promethearchaeota archaeon]
MSLVPSIKNDVKNEVILSKFIDFDKDKNIFYNNIYLEDFKFVIKIPLLEKASTRKDIKIKKFDLTKYTFLLSYK